MRRKILPFILGGALAIAAVAPAAASNHQTANLGGVQNALIGLLVQAVVRDVEVVDINDSLNNLLQNALQNADILNDLEVTVQNVLNNLNVNISDIEIEVLENGDIVVTVLGSGGIIDTITLT